ncbi:MAG: holo-ACP synthase [Actinomycetes bacterium]
MTHLPGVGIDLLEISRLEVALERRPGLKLRLFDKDEIKFCERSRRPARQLATRFCAKEATIKALGLSSACMRDIVVRGGGVEPPRILLKGHAARVARDNGVSVSISLTHERGMAAAVALTTRP